MARPFGPQDPINLRDVILAENNGDDPGIAVLVGSTRHVGVAKPSPTSHRDLGMTAAGTRILDTSAHFDFHRGEARSRGNPSAHFDEGLEREESDLDAPHFVG